MMSVENKIVVMNDSKRVVRSNEELMNVWSLNTDSIQMPTNQGAFSFTGPSKLISDKVSQLINQARENVYISTSRLTDSRILKAIENAVSKNVRIYLLIDTSGFKDFLEYDGSSGVLGHILTRERIKRGIDVVLSDWKLASKKGYLLNTPLDSTLSNLNGNWCLELDSNQIDEIRNHSEHEFWNTTKGLEVLSPNSSPELINSRPYSLKKLSNAEYILRSVCASDADDSKAEADLRKEKKWQGLVVGDSLQSNIILHGEAIEVGTGAKQVIHSSPKSVEPATGLFAHSGLSLQLAIGAESYLAGWDRSAKGDWHSILRLNAEQAKAAKALLQKHSESPEWIGHSKIKLGEAGNRIIRDGKDMKIPDSQTLDLGVVHLDEMPESAKELQNHKPALNPPETDLARECTFEWISAPPVPSASASKDGLHAEWIGARDMISKRLNALDELNVVSKIPGFGRKAKELQKSIGESIEKLGIINDPKSLSDLVDQVEKLTTSVGGNLDAIKAAEDEEARQKLEDEQREAHKLAVDKAKASVKSLEPRLKKMNAELDKLKKSANKAKDVEKKKLESDISQLTPKIKQLGSELKNARDLSNSKFEFKAPPTLPSSKKKDGKSHRFLGDTREPKLEVKVPKEGLPQFGTLYKDGVVRYLAVSDWAHVEQGREDATRLKATLCASRGILE